MEHRILNRYPLGNKRFIWKQKDFTLSTFSCYPQSDGEDGEPSVVADKAIGNLKEAGFNLLELGWVGHRGAWAAVDACEKHEIDLLFQDMTIMGGMQHRRLDNKVPYSVVEELVSKLENKKHTVGYYVWDEPHTEEQYAEARRQMDMLEKAAPEALLFTVAIPSCNPANNLWENGRFEPMARRFLECMNPPVVSFDYYPIGDYFNCWQGHKFIKENQLDDTFMWLDLAFFSSLAKENDLPLWFYYQGFHLMECTDYFIFPMVRCFMYAAILHGAKGLQNYTAGEKGNKLILPNGEKGEFFEDQKQIHSEIKALGNTLMALRSELIYHSKELLPDCEYIKPYINSIDESNIFCGELPHRVSVGELCDDYGNRYALILNRDYEKSLDCVLKLKGNFRIYEVSRTDGSQNVKHDCVSELPVKLAQGDAMLIRIQKADEAPFTVEYKLEK